MSTSLRRLRRYLIWAAIAAVQSLTTAYAYPTFNGHGDYEIDSHGSYYTLSGGLFPTGNSVNGANGAIAYLSDDPYWGVGIDAWHADSWYAGNSGMALTLKNGSNIVYDNNGLENNTFPLGFYTYGSSFPSQGQGVVTGYSMANNYDFIYAGYVKLNSAITIDQLIGYFVFSGNPNDALTGPFDPNDPAFHYHMNLWSNAAGNLPTNTGSFVGDVFSSDDTAGAFSWSDTGNVRTGSASQQHIYRLTYTLDNPLTLQAGTYWFSHDATIPEPATLALVGVALGALGLLRRRA